MTMKIVTIANFSVALEGERSKEELEAIAKKIRRTCLSEKDIVYAPSVWLDDYDVREMDIISPKHSVTEHKIKEGWAFGAGSQKAHYFVEGISLCRCWGFFYGPLEQGKDDSPDNCAACMKALAKRKAKVKQ